MRSPSTRKSTELPPKPLMWRAVSWVMASPNSSPGISCVSMSWILVASAILMSWRVISRVTTGASFRVFGEWEAVTTIGFSSTESRKAVCAERGTTGMAKAMPAKREYVNFLNNLCVTTYFLVPVNCPSKAKGILPYFCVNVITTFLSLKMTVMSLMV